MTNPLLEVEEFERLTPAEQVRYLRLLKKHGSAAKTLGGLTERQQAAVQLLDTVGVDELLYGGAAGGGKSELIVRWAIRRCLETPDMNILLLRATLPQVRATLMRRCIRLFADFDNPPTWRNLDRMWEFDNRSILWIGYLQHEDDGYQYLSVEYEAICGDEATHLNPAGLEIVKTRLRTTKPNQKSQLVLATNPGGPGHRTILNRYPIIPNSNDKTFFYRNKVVGTIRTEHVTTPIGTKQLKLAFIPSKVQDNPHISSDYVTRLSAAPERIRRMYLEGDWNVFEGQFFSEFNPETHVKQFDPPNRDRTWVGLDFGWASPFAAIFTTIGTDNELLVYDEIYHTKITPQQQATMILNRAEQWKTLQVIADPSAWNESTGGSSVALKWAKAGLPVSPGINNRVPGWLALRERFTTGKIVIHPRCENLIRELLDATVSERNPEDIDPKCSDHALDALRYVHETVHVPRRTPRRPLTPHERDWNRLVKQRTHRY